MMQSLRVSSWEKQDGWATAGREGAQGCPYWAPWNPSDQEAEPGELRRMGQNTQKLIV